MKKASWEKEFDKMFLKRDFKSDVVYHAVLDFISQELKREREKTVKAFINYELMKKWKRYRGNLTFGEFCLKEIDNYLERKK